MINLVIIKCKKQTKKKKQEKFARSSPEGRTAQNPSLVPPPQTHTHARARAAGLQGAARKGRARSGCTRRASVQPCGCLPSSSSSPHTTSSARAVIKYPLSTPHRVSSRHCRKKWPSSRRKEKPKGQLLWLRTKRTTGSHPHLALTPQVATVSEKARPLGAHQARSSTSLAQTWLGAERRQPVSQDHRVSLSRGSTTPTPTPGDRRLRGPNPARAGARCHGVPPSAPATMAVRSLASKTVATGADRGPQLPTDARTPRCPAQRRAVPGRPPGPLPSPPGRQIPTLRKSGYLGRGWRWGRYPEEQEEEEDAGLTPGEIWKIWKSCSALGDSCSLRTRTEGPEPITPPLRALPSRGWWEAAARTRALRAPSRDPLPPPPHTHTHPDCVT
jgi:hypothetical protein